MAYLCYNDKTKFKKKYINPILLSNLVMIIPDEPNSRSQKYLAQSDYSLT